MRWEPFSQLRRLQEDMDRLFHEVFTGRPALSALERWAPRVDLYETEKEVVVKADLPGLTKKDVEVTVEEDAVTIQGETKKDEEVKDEGYYRRERHYGKFVRTIPVPTAIDTEKAKATFKDGILEVRLPKVEAKPKGKKVTIE